MHQWKECRSTIFCTTWKLSSLSLWVIAANNKQTCVPVNHN